MVPHLPEQREEHLILIGPAEIRGRLALTGSVNSRFRCFVGDAYGADARVFRGGFGEVKNDVR